MNEQNLDRAKMKQKRKTALFWLGIAAGVSGCIDAFTEHDGLIISIVRLLMSLIAIAIIYYWIVYDAKLYDYRIPKYLKYIIILFAIVGIPLYFWQTRSFKAFCYNLAGIWLFIYYGFIYYICAVIMALLLSGWGYY